MEKALTDIPQTKKNNPIPGKVEYSAVHNCANDYGYMIPMTWDVDDVLVIAAHANVSDMTSGVTEILAVSAAGPGIDVYGPLGEYKAPGDAAWTGPVDAVATYVHPSWPSITGATWISNTSLIDGDIAGNSWRWFTDEFEVPGYPMSASVVTATADNAEEVYLNGVFVGSDGEVQGPYVDNSEWGTVLDYGIAPVMGTNTLDFIVRNYPGSSNPEANPTGLIYEVEVEYLARGEIAWGNGTDFGGKQWGMWFNYTVQEGLFETIMVPSRNAAGTGNEVVTSAALVDGADYELRANGTYRFANWGANGIADAQCSLRPDGTWLNGNDIGTPRENYLEVWAGDIVAPAAIDWSPGTCQPSYLYTSTFTSVGIPVSFTIMDACSPTVDGCYGDNSGYITVEIWWTGN